MTSLTSNIGEERVKDGGYELRRVCMKVNCSLDLGPDSVAVQLFVQC